MPVGVGDVDADLSILHISRKSLTMYLTHVASNRPSSNIKVGTT